MFSTFNVSYFILVLIKTVLSYSPTVNNESKNVFTSIPNWLLSIIILMGIFDFLIAIYLIWKYFKRRNRKEYDGNKKIENSKTEIAVELQTADISPSINITEVDISSSTTKEDLFDLEAFLHETYNTSFIKEGNNLTSVVTNTKHNQCRVIEVPFDVSTFDNFQEGDMNEDTTSLIYKSQENKFKGVEKSFSKQEELQESENNNPASDCNDLNNKRGNNLEHLYIEADETPEDSIVKENNEFESQEEIFVEEEPKNTMICLNNKEYEFIKKQSLVEVKEPINNKEINTAVVLLNEGEENHEVSSEDPFEETLYAPKKSEIIRALKNLRSINSENMNFTKYLPSVKTQNRGTIKN